MAHIEFHSKLYVRTWYVVIVDFMPPLLMDFLCHGFCNYFTCDLTYVELNSITYPTILSGPSQGKYLKTNPYA
jgi:hypothetical protein